MAGATTESADDQVRAPIATDRGLTDRVCPRAPVPSVASTPKLEKRLGGDAKMPG